MSEEHGATTVRASKGGNGSKWLLGAAAAVVLIGGGYFAWKAMTPDQSRNDLAYNDAGYQEPLRAGTLEDDGLTAESAAADAAPASSASRSTAPSRRATTPAAAPIPEETIGITPVSATTEYTYDDTGDDIVVTAPPRPVWDHTPSSERLAALYPESARNDNREGEASLRCTVQTGGALDCVRTSETPGGFGAAAMRVARTLRHAPQRADGASAVGSALNLHVVFRLEDTHRG